MNLQRIIMPLTRDFLQSHGVKFDGAFWVNEILPFRLTASQTLNTWMVTIPNLPANIQQPSPISNYSDLIRLMLSLCPAYLQKTVQDLRPLGLNQEQTMQKIVEAFAKLFTFDNCIRFNLQFGPQGFGINPGNEYTHTLLVGRECEFKVVYQVLDDNKSRDMDTFEFTMAPECVSLDFICTQLGAILGVGVDIKITSVEIVDENNEYKPFYGAGIKFQ